MTLRMISDYKQDFAYRSSFNALALTTFGIAFEPWYEAGFWGDDYVCTSYAVGTDIVANVSTTRLNLTVNGRIVPAIQIGTVMTRPDYRGQGLSRKLMETVLAQADEKTAIFLFANQSVLDYYPKFGFRPLAESGFSIRSSAGLETLHAEGSRRPPEPAVDGEGGRDGARNSRGQLRPVVAADPEAWERIRGLFARRTPVSDVLGVPGGESIALWHVMNGLAGCLYELPGVTGLVICEADSQRLTIYDIVCERQADIRLLFEAALRTWDGEVQPLFSPDLLGGEAAAVPSSAADSVLFVRGEWVPDGVPFRYPVTAQT